MKRMITLGLGVLSVNCHAFSAKEQMQLLQSTPLQAIEAETNADNTREELDRALKSISDSDLPGKLDSLASDASPAAAEFRELLVRRWAESDAPAAAGWTSQLPDGPAYRDALAQVAIAWANSDLVAARDWMRALPEGKSTQAATIAFAYEAARTQPVMALEIAGILQPTVERDNLLIHAVSQWAVSESSTAVSWAMQVPDSALRQHLIAAIAVATAEHDGAAAATLAANSIESGDEQDRTGISIVQRWAQHSPQAAASWVALFPDVPSRDEAVRDLMTIWVERDPGAAGKWLSGLPDGRWHDFDFGITARAQAPATSLFDPEPTPAQVENPGGR